MSNCLVCESKIESFMSFGRQPLANGFLKSEQFNQEYFFEMKVAFCQECKMFQLTEQPDREQMFHENYAFFSGTSKHMTLHFQKFAKSVRQKYLDQQDPLVVEIGSNDGIMLKNFVSDGIRHVGVEPSANVAAVARQNGVNTICEFFDKTVAAKIVKEQGQADAFLAANVMCHIPYMHSVIEGIGVLLKPTGVAVFEDPYLGEVIENTSYDQIYDEHVFLFSLMSISNLFKKHGMEIIDAEPQETHGGSMRYTIARKGARPIAKTVQDLLEKEKSLGLDKAETYLTFRKNCEKSREDLTLLLRDLKKQNKRVVGYAATSKSTTITNYCNITSDLVEFISDTTPIKQGKFSPGTHIPVLPVEKFVKDYPDYALLFGYNHKKEILEKEKEFTKLGGQWILYVPKVQVFNNDSLR